MIRPADSPAARDPQAKAGRELVVMTHGIASTRLLLIPMAARLRRAGFATRLHGYPSIWWSNRNFGRRMAALLRRLAPRYDRIHLLGHSMGGIVARCALEEELPPNFGRVVQIAPPNRGSHMATRLTIDAEEGWAPRVWNQLVVRPHRDLSPTLCELRDTPDSFVNQLGPVPKGIEVGVLAATYDNVLHPEQTHLDGQVDHHTLDSWHTGILWRRETAELTARFLKTGSFSPSDEPSRRS